jgi:uroporphyrinogen-III synthase
MDLSSYSHLAFTSKNGILAVLQRLQQLKGGKHCVMA